MKPVLFAISVLASFVTAAHAGAPAKPPLEQDCFYQLIEGTGANIDCEYKAWMTAEEKTDVSKLTRGYLLDASCLIDVKIARDKVDAAIAASDLTFESPAQPMTCNLTTSSGPMTIKGTFAPKVVFKDGQAISATPGLANIEGINSYLAWPVVHYINNADRIGGPMKLIINAYRARRGELSKSTTGPAKTPDTSPKK